jgi:serine protease DegQ
VLTNNHVTQGADDIAVTLHDNRTVKARVVGSDPDTDLTVLQIPADGLQALTLAASRDLRVGDFVVAIGDPFGLGQTVTSGIVSALDRKGLSRGYQNFIQTDASINPGNSGGALVNLRGELVGINSMIFSPSGASVGIGFAIPSDLAANVMRQLVEYGEVRRGALGVDTQDITPELARMLSVTAGKGTVVTRVRKDAPADTAGLQPGDVIVEINGKVIGSGQDLHNIEGLTPIGTPLSVSLLRGGKPLVVKMTLSANTVASVRGGDLDERLAGVQLRDLDESQRRPGLSGSGVKNIDRSSRAYASGLRSGDIIVGINQRDIDDTGDLSDLLQRTPRQLLLTVVRGQSLFYLLLQ